MYRLYVLHCGVIFTYMGAGAGAPAMPGVYIAAAAIKAILSEDSVIRRRHFMRISITHLD